MIRPASRKKYSTLFTVCLYGLIASALISCASFGKGQKNNNENLVKSVEAFNNAVRWEEYKAAAAFLSPLERDEFWDLSDRIQKNIRIMDFQVRDITLADDKLSGKAVIRYRYYSPSDPYVQSKTVHQKLRFDAKEKAWHITRHDLDLLVPNK